MQEVDDLTRAVIGCAMKVHSQLGNGFQEVIYQRAFSIELEKNSIPHQREVERKIYYDNIEIGTRRVDFYIDKRITVE
jgi:GxxExxY protein